MRKLRRQVRNLTETVCEPQNLLILSLSIVSGIAIVGVMHSVETMSSTPLERRYMEIIQRAVKTETNDPTLARKLQERLEDPNISKKIQERLADPKLLSDPRPSEPPEKILPKL